MTSIVSIFCGQGLLTSVSENSSAKCEAEMELLIMDVNFSPNLLFLSARSDTKLQGVYQGVYQNEPLARIS